MHYLNGLLPDCLSVKSNLGAKPFDHMKICSAKIQFQVNQTHFRIKDFARGFVLKQSHKGLLITYSSFQQLSEKVHWCFLSKCEGKIVKTVGKRKNFD